MDKFRKSSLPASSLSVESRSKQMHQSTNLPQGLSVSAASSSHRNRSKSVCEPKLVALREEESLITAGGSYPSSPSPPPSSSPLGRDKETHQSTSSTASKSTEKTAQKGGSRILSPLPAPSPTPSCTKDDDNPHSSFFGVRSYLHHFYDSVALRDADQFEEFEEYRYLIAPKKKRRTLMIWRFVFWSGLSVLVMGAVLLLLGYFVPRREIIIGYQDKEIAIIDQWAVKFNKNLEWFKVLGLGIFCIGGFMLSMALLLPSLIGISCFEDEEEFPPFKVKIGRSRSTSTGSADSESEEADDEDEKNKAIPVTQQVKPVQPRKEEEQAICTGKGFTKLK